MNVLLRLSARVSATNPVNKESSFVLTTEKVETSAPAIVTGALIVAKRFLLTASVSK